MLYSVYDWNTKIYKYYEGKESKRSIPSYKELGVTPDDIAISLPNDAKLVGTGTEAKGTVATTESRGGGLFKYVVIGAIIALFVAPRFWRD